MSPSLINIARHFSLASKNALVSKGDMGNALLTHGTWGPLNTLVIHIGGNVFRKRCYRQRQRHGESKEGIYSEKLPTVQNRSNLHRFLERAKFPNRALPDYFIPMNIKDSVFNTGKWLRRLPRQPISLQKVNIQKLLIDSSDSAF